MLVYAPGGTAGVAAADDAYGIPVIQGTPGGWEEIERLLHRGADPGAPAPAASADRTEDGDG